MSHRTRGLLATLVTSLALLTACSSGEAPQVQPADGPADGPAPGPGAEGDSPSPEGAGQDGSAAASGLLVAEGSGYIHTYDLASDDGWQQRLRYAGPWSTVAFAEDDRELLIANTSGAEPVVVSSHNVDTFAQAEPFEWPDTTHITSLHAMAATDDGDYLALVMEPLHSPFLEVVERSTGRVVYTGLDIATGARMAWTSDDRLVVPIDLSHEDNSERWGAIAAFSLPDLEAATDANVDGQLIATFTRAEWDVQGVEDLALSPDDSEIVFERGGDLWVVDLEPGSTPHQLTTGAPGNFGAVFSPDGSQVALTSSGDHRRLETYIIGTHRGDPTRIDGGQDVGTEFLLEHGTLASTIVAWVP